MSFFFGYSFVKVYFPREYGQQARDARVEQFKSNARMRGRVLRRRVIFWGGWF